VLDEIDAFLKAHGVFEPTTIADLKCERGRSTGSASEVACGLSSRTPGRCMI
jgi:hypothetical protein